MDSLLEVLADGQRRFVVTSLQDHAGSMTVGDLTRSYVSSEINDADTLDAEDVWLRLYHVHLPKLHDANVVVFDADRKIVEPGDDFALAESLLVDATACSC